MKTRGLRIANRACLSRSGAEFGGKRCARRLSDAATFEPRCPGWAVPTFSKACLSRVLSCLLCALGFAALGQFSVTWSAVEGGGGTSTGGNYSLSGTVGQPSAGTMSGGQFTLQGGFWPGMIVPSSGEAPTLYLQFSGDSVTISWSPSTPGFVLEATTDLTGAAWTTAPAGNPVSVQVTGPATFYRLKKP